MSTHSKIPHVSMPSQHPGGFEAWAADQINDRLANPAWDELADAYNVTLPPADDPMQRADELYGLSDAVWNLRGKQRDATGLFVERWHVQPPADVKVYDEPGNSTGERIMRGSSTLSMIESAPLGGDKLAACLVLGGAARACWQRTQLSMGYELSTPNGEDQPPVSWHPRYNIATPDTFSSDLWGEVVTVGSQAPMNEAVRKQFAGITPDSMKQQDVLTEADIQYISARYLLKQMSGDVREYGPMKIADVGYEATGLGAVRVITGGKRTVLSYEAPNPANSDRPRANTDEGFKMVSAAAPELFTPDTNIGIATNAIYTPFQEASFLNYISRYTGAVPVMATFSAAEGGVDRKPSQLLPELHSAARKYYEFYHPEHAA
jgi:hypothetical protein